MKENIIIGGDAVKNAICHYVAFSLGDRVTDEEYYKIINFIHPNTIRKIRDEDFIKNKRLRQFIDYSRLDRKQVVRLITRDITMFSQINLNDFNFSVNELEYFLANHPKYVRNFNFDLKLISGKEIIILLKADLNYLYEVDFINTKFSRLDFQDLIKYFYDIPQIIEKINPNDLDNFLTRSLIIKTTNKYVNKLKLEKLNCLDWFEILKNCPELIQYCDIKLFETGDYFTLAQLICAVPELDYLMENHYDELSALAWEKLLLSNTEKYSNICDYKKFKEINWKNILKKKPYLSIYKD